MTHIRTLTIALLWTTLVAGCESTEQITLRSELREAGRAKKSIHIMTNDGAFLMLSTYTLEDSAIVGVGMQKIQDSLVSFTGRIPLARILYIEKTGYAWFKTLLALGAAGYVAGSAIAILTEDVTPTGITALDRQGLYDPRPRSTTGTRSCPTVYSWDGAGFSLDAEAFSIAWGRALEMTTCSILPSLRLEDHNLRVQVRNERPETHYHNKIRLLRADVPESTPVVIDTEDRLLAVSALIAPAEAMTPDGASVQASLLNSDGLFWESSLSTARPGGTYRDIIEVRFRTDTDCRRGVLVINARNTDIFDVVLSQVSSILGDATLAFVYALEHDQDLVRLMQRWQEDAALRISVRNGSEWTYVGRFLPEANAVNFTRGLVLDLPACDDAVEIKLECLADVWKIDAVTLDRSEPRVISWQEVTCTSAMTDRGEDIRALLADRDDMRIAVVPPQVITLGYQTHPAEPGSREVYALEATGYLHEWMPASTASVDVAARTMSESARVAILKTLLGAREILLPMIYTRWQSTQQKRAGDLGQSKKTALLQ